MRPVFISLSVASLAAPVQGHAASPIAEVICAPRHELVQTLRGQFGEQQMGVGMRGPESVMEIWTSDKSGDWTLVMSYTDGRSCIVAIGENWQQIAPPAS